jgi:predicted phage terminase large subunit-like protein
VEGGNLIRREWWKYYDPAEIKAFATTLISVDATFKDAETNDFVAIEVWSKLGANYYLRYAINQHLNFPNTVQMIRLVKKLFPESQYILIEDKANGSAIIQTLRSEFIGVIAVTPKGGKVARVNAVSPAIESGNVYLPYGQLWAESLVEQFTAFPAGKHDDMVDSASQALSYMIFSNGLAELPLSDEARMLQAAEMREQQVFLSPSMYNVYDNTDGFW